MKIHMLHSSHILLFFSFRPSIPSLAHTFDNKHLFSMVSFSLSLSPLWLQKRYSLIAQINKSNTKKKGLPLAPIGNLSSGYWRLTLKTTLAFHYAYEHFLNDYDWFVKADDDTYLFIENLRLFLQTKNTSEPIT